MKILRIRTRERAQLFEITKMVAEVVRKSGVREGVLKHCDFRLRIPMTGQVGSLNASVSAGILLYEVARQRGSTPVR